MWSSTFKKERMSEFNNMLVKDRMNVALTSEYYGVINGQVDPKATHYFSNENDMQKFDALNRNRIIRLTRVLVSDDNQLKNQMKPSLSARSSISSQSSVNLFGSSRLSFIQRFRDLWINI